MKLACSVLVGNRLSPTFSITSNNKGKHAKSTLAICKHPKSNDFCIILFSGQNKNGSKYILKENVLRVLTGFINEGKATIQFKIPPHDIYVHADHLQLKSFLHLLRRALENKILPKELISSMSVKPISTKYASPKKLVIRTRTDYAVEGFPHSLEALHVNNIQCYSFASAIFRLANLRILDLSHNCIEHIPSELNQLPCLAEFNVSHNQIGKSTPNQWTWIGGNLSRTLKLLNMSNNNLKYLPNQLVKLYNIISLHIDNNELKSLPSGIGSLKHLRVLTVSHNSITVLPGTAKKWCLQTLDLSNNSFDPNYQNNPAAIYPKPLPVCTLKEYAARKVLCARILYTSEILPHTIITYLDDAKYCVCGKACFDIYIRHPYMLLLISVAESFSVSSGLVYVPMDCYFCSLKCFGTANYTRARNPVI